METYCRRHARVSNHMRQRVGKEGVPKGWDGYNDAHVKKHEALGGRVHAIARLQLRVCLARKVLAHAAQRVPIRIGLPRHAPAVAEDGATAPPLVEAFERLLRRRKGLPRQVLAARQKGRVAAARVVDDGIVQHLDLDGTSGMVNTGECEV